MSGKTLPLQELEQKNDSSIKGSITKTCIENANENQGKFQKNVSPCLILNEVDVGSNGSNVVSLEVEYIESEDLTDVLSVDACLSTLLARLDSKDWVSTCEALNNVRQLSIHHKDTLLDMLGDLIPLIVKSLKNPRSAVCKTAIMASADMFKVYSDLIVDSFDPLLLQLLLKSSQDKRFVCEAAETALVAMTTWFSPSLLLPKVQPYLKHKNPRIRAKASMCISRIVPHLGVEGIIVYGIEKLIQIAASQLKDQLPESREAARLLTMELQSIFEKSRAASLSEEEHFESWEAFCQAQLSPLGAQAILRVASSSPKDQIGV